MIDPAVEAAYRDSFAARGAESVTFTRIVGDDVNTQQVQATVPAVVTRYQPDTNAMAREGFKPEGVGTITQGDRHILVLEGDLKKKGFPVPLQKNDKAKVGTETLTITAVDLHTRASAGCYELIAAGV